MWSKKAEKLGIEELNDRKIAQINVKQKAKGLDALELLLQILIKFN
jgi:hypothetical protein